MKTFFFLLLTTLGLRAQGAEVKASYFISWSPTPTPGLATYTLLSSSNVITASTPVTTLIRANAGTNTIIRIDVDTAIRWYFATTASVGGAESVFSNVIFIDPPTNSITLPPTQLRSFLIVPPPVQVVIPDILPGPGGIPTSQLP